MPLQHGVEGIAEKLGVVETDVDHRARVVDAGHLDQDEGAILLALRGLAEPDIVEKISGAMKNLAVIAADNPEREALAIAVAMREARHLGK